MPDDAPNQQLHSDWLATVINPGTPINYPNTTNQSGYAQLYSLPTDFSTPSYEPAEFDYDRSLQDVTANTYGQPYPPSDFSLSRRASSADDDLPANPVLLNLTNREDLPAEPPVAAAQEPEVKRRIRGRTRGGKGGRGAAREDEEDKENVHLAKNGKKEKRKMFKHPPAACKALTEAVYDVSPFAAPHGKVLKSWETVVSKLQPVKHFDNMKVPAIRTLVDQLLEWHHDPETSETAQMIEEALKGTSEEITMGALLDKISETRQTAEGRTEEEKVKKEKKDDYDKRGGDSLRRNSMKSMHGPDSPRTLTSPRHYIPPQKPTEVINIDGSDDDTDGSISPSRGSSPLVENELPVSQKKRSAAVASLSQISGRRHKRSKSFKEGDLLDPLLAAVRDGQEQQRRAQKSLEQKLLEGVEKTNEVIREQTTQYVAIFKDLAAAIKK